MTIRPHPSAMQDAPNAIRICFDESEFPALVFNERALPGALVSWAWCQLTSLDALLVAIVGKSPGCDGETDVAGAVRAFLVPVINALEFSEHRANELQNQIDAAPTRRSKKVAAKAKRAAAAARSA